MKRSLKFGAGRIAVVLATFLWMTPPSAAGQSEIFVPLGGRNEIAVIDPTQDKVVSWIRNVPAVHGLAATPDGQYLIAGSYAERDDSNAQPRPTGVSDADHAAHHAKPKAGTNANRNNQLSTVSILKRSDRSIVRRVDVEGAVHHVAIDPKGRFAAVTHPNSGGVSVIDLSTFGIVAKVETGELPNYAVFAPDGKRLYVSNAGSQSITEIDAGSWQAVRQMAVGNSPEHVVITRDGMTLFVNNVDDGFVSALDLTTGRVATTYPIGDTLHGIDLSDDGKTLFVAAMGEERVVAVNIATSQGRSVDLSPAPYHLAFIRGHGKIYITSADKPQIWVVNATDLTVRSVIDIGGKGHQIVQVSGR